MSEFVSRWSEWESADTSRQGTVKTAKSPSIGSVSTKAEGPVPSREEIVAMTLDAFAHAGLIVRVYSEVLGGEVLFVSDDVSEAALGQNELPVYRSAELRKLALLKPERSKLRRLHMVKEIFQGTITRVEARSI